MLVPRGDDAVATIGRAHTGGMALVGPARPGAHRGGEFGRVADHPRFEAMLRDTHTDWSAAINGSSAAAELELSTNTAVMAIGGSGSTPQTLGEFKQDVANRQLHADDGRERHRVRPHRAVGVTPLPFG